MYMNELQELIRHAKDYRDDAVDSVHRNSHMNELRWINEQDEVDAVLVDFINYIGRKKGIDLALYTIDIQSETK